MKIAGRALTIRGDDVGVDLIYPARYLTITDRADQAKHMFEGLDRSLPDRIRASEVIVTGWNLGSGSIREQAVTVLLGANVKLVIGKSFSRVFFRNAVNAGLPLIEAPALADQIRDDDELVVDLAAGVCLINGREARFEPVSAFIRHVAEAGGLWHATAAPMASSRGRSRTPSRPQSLVEKLFSRAAGYPVYQNEIVEITPDLTFGLDDGIEAIAAYLAERKVARIKNPERASLFFDHYAPANNAQHSNVHAIGRRFAESQRLAAVHDVGSGISHQIAVETGLVRPGMIAVNIDSHNMTIGAVGAVGLGVGNSEMAYLWAHGTTWFRIPATISITLTGRLRPGVAAKDIALGIIAAHGLRWAGYKAVHFTGPGVADLDIAQRMTLCNMCTELGAKTALFAFDRRTVAFFAERGIDVSDQGIEADPGAIDAETAKIDLSAVEPLIACPPSLDRICRVSALSEVKISQAYLGTCTNGHYEDLAAAATILRGRKIATGVRMIVTPASHEVLLRASRDGTIADLLAAGCTLATPGCGACCGVHQGALADGEVCVSSGSRNYPGRMGSRTASIYLGSAETVAASALAGYIDAPVPAAAPR
jgi:homoaconitate hydratase family protein/3-isopropylmalate dehydratase small subunit